MSHRAARVTACLLPALALIACAVPSAGAAPLGEVHLFTGLFAPSTLAPGPEGEMWLGGGTSTTVLSPAGQTTTLNTASEPTGDMVAGSDGNMWFTERAIDSTVVGRITAGGEEARFDENGNFDPHWVTLGPDGDIWWTAGEPGVKKIGENEEGAAIGRITPSGIVTEFTLGLNPKSSLQEITTGPDGNLWFINDGSPYAIGRVTPTGEIKEFTITGKPWLKPAGIAAGSNGNVYFGAAGENAEGEEEDVIGEITSAGTIKIAKRMDIEPLYLAAGPEGSLWFTALPTEPDKPYVIAQLTPEGKLTEFTFLGPDTEAAFISPGPEGNMWFTALEKESDARRVGTIGTGAPAPSQAAPVVTGAAQVGAQLACDGATFSTWAGQEPSVSLYGFDGYSWQLDGHPIAGQNGQTFAVPAADLGHQISCSARATYKLLNVSVSAASAPVLIGAAPVIAPPASRLALPHQTDKVSSRGALRLTIVCSGAPCSGSVSLTEKIKVSTGKGRNRHRRTVSLTIATARFSSLAIGTHTVSLKLTRRGLSLLAGAHYKLAATAAITYTTRGSGHASLAGPIELKGSRPGTPHRKG